MVKDERSWTERHDAYWEAEGREAAVSQLRGTCVFILILQYVMPRILNSRMKRLTRFILGVSCIIVLILLRLFLKFGEC